MWFKAAKVWFPPKDALAFRQSQETLLKSVAKGPSAVSGPVGALPGAI